MNRWLALSLLLAFYDGRCQVTARHESAAR